MLAMPHQEHTGGDAFWKGPGQSVGADPDQILWITAGRRWQHAPIPLDGNHPPDALGRSPGEAQVPGPDV
jgi:hypothetical protein